MKILCGLLISIVFIFQIQETFSQQAVKNNNTTQRLLCNAGEYLGHKGVNEFCYPCSPGSVQDLNQHRCESCNFCIPGYVQPMKGQISCRRCLGNQYQDLAGQAYCKRCPSGTTGYNTHCFGVGIMFNGVELFRDEYLNVSTNCLIECIFEITPSWQNNIDSTELVSSNPDYGSSVHDGIVCVSTKCTAMIRTYITGKLEKGDNFYCRMQVGYIAQNSFKLTNGSPMLVSASSALLTVIVLLQLFVIT